MNGRATWIIVGLIVSWALTAGGAVWAFSADRAAMLAQVDANEHSLTDHEQRLRALERIANDVRWIRNEMEADR